jgi:hypothetical protein
MSPSFFAGGVAAFPATTAFLPAGGGAAFVLGAVFLLVAGDGVDDVRSASTTDDAASLSKSDVYNGLTAQLATSPDLTRYK